MRVRELISGARARLASESIDSPAREARLLLASVLARTEIALLAHDDDEVSPDESDRFLDLVERRGRGEPFAYLAGSKEFYGRVFQVDSRVLIPRPETEALVEIALALDLPDEARVLDVGTGSGAIALTLAAERPRWKLVASDLSVAALACARANRELLGLGSRVALIAADLTGPIDLSSFDLVVSNPPYIDLEDSALVERGVRSYEPHLALFADQSGLERIAGLCDAARGLRDGVHLALEIGYGQVASVKRLAQSRPWLELVEVRLDTAGIERDVVFKRSRGVR